MHLALLQAQQNELYRFDQPDKPYTMQQAKALQQDMMDETFAMMQAAKGCDLVVTTEAVNYPGDPEKLQGDWTTLLPDESSPLWEKLSQEAKKLNAYLVYGCYRLKGGKPYNTAMIYGPDGALAEAYDKIQLAPGGEQIYLTPGSRFVTVDAPFGRFAPCICWDMQFPEIPRTLALMGARLVVCPTWGWEGVYAHARAYENDIYVAGAMAVPAWMPIQGLRNPSEVVAQWGEVIASAPRDRAAVLTCELDLSRHSDEYPLHMGDRRPEMYGALTGGLHHANR